MDSKRKLEEDGGPQPPKEAKMDDNEVKDGKVNNDEEQEKVEEEEQGREDEANMDDEEEAPRLRVSNDCWLDVLGRLNHRDLDECVTLSEISHNWLECIGRTQEQFKQLINSSRKNAGKIVVSKLTVSQEHSGEIHIYMNIENDLYRLKLDNCFSTTSKFVKLSQDDRKLGRCKRLRPRRIAAVRAFFDRVSILLSRFTIEKFVMTTVDFDHEMLQFIKKLSILPQSDAPKSSFELIIRNNHETIRSLDEKLLKEIQTYIRQARSTRLVLRTWSKVDENIFDYALLKSYSENVILPSIVFHKGWDEYSQLYTADENFMEILPNYGSFDLDGFLVNSDGVIHAVMNRLLKNTNGEWKFFITREIFQHEIEQAMHSQMEIRQRGARCWDVKTNESTVNIFVSMTGGRGRSFIARFYSNDST